MAQNLDDHDPALMQLKMRRGGPCTRSNQAKSLRDCDETWTSNTRENLDRYNITMGHRLAFPLYTRDSYGTPTIRYVAGQRRTNTDQGQLYLCQRPAGFDSNHFGFSVLHNTVCVCSWRG
jgi:hypothetical protein